MYITNYRYAYFIYQYIFFNFNYKKSNIINKKKFVNSNLYCVTTIKYHLDRNYILFYFFIRTYSINFSNTIYSNHEKSVIFRRRAINAKEIYSISKMNICHMYYSLYHFIGYCNRIRNYYFFTSFKENFLILLLSIYLSINLSTF